MSHVRFGITWDHRITPTACSTLGFTRNRVQVRQKGDPVIPGDPIFDMTRERADSHESCQIRDHLGSPDHPYRL